MSRFERAAAALAVAAIASCAPRAVPPSAPPPAPPAPPPPAPPPAPAVEWTEAPLSPGDWSYRDGGGSSSAVYGTAFAIACQGGRIGLTRIAAGTGNAMTVRTTYGERTLPAAPSETGLTAGLAESDPLLDQIVFSRGRFLVQAAGAPPLILPAWPEPARVIEDCRD